MSFRANRLRHSPPDDEGYVLPTVIVVLTIGAMVAIALLGYAAALLKAGGDDADSVLHLYAADAGITTMKHRLERGTVTPPEPFMFGDDIEVQVAVTPNPMPHAPLPTHTVTPHPIDPGLPDLFDEDQDPVIVIINSVPLGTELDVRWQYSLFHPPLPRATSTPTAVLPSIEVYVRMGQQIKGTPTPTPITTSDPCEDYQPDDQRGCVEVRQPLGLPERVENIELFFAPGDHVVSTPRFERACTAQNRSHFCLTAAPLYYVVVSKTDSATVTAYIRQFPGWHLDDSSDDGVTYKRSDVVEILSWKPYANPTPTPNSDDEQDEAQAPDE